MSIGEILEKLLKVKMNLILFVIVGFFWGHANALGDGLRSLDAKIINGQLNLRVPVMQGTAGVRSVIEGMKNIEQRLRVGQVEGSGFYDGRSASQIQTQSLQSQSRFSTQSVPQRIKPDQYLQNKEQTIPSKSYGDHSSTMRSIPLLLQEKQTSSLISPVNTYNGWLDSFNKQRLYQNRRHQVFNQHQNYKENQQAFSSQQSSDDRKQQMFTQRFANDNKQELFPLRMSNDNQQELFPQRLSNDNQKAVFPLRLSNDNQQALFPQQLSNDNRQAVFPRPLSSDKKEQISPQRFIYGNQQVIFPRLSSNDKQGHIFPQQFFNDNQQDIFVQRSSNNNQQEIFGQRSSNNKQQEIHHQQPNKNVQAPIPTQQFRSEKQLSISQIMNSGKQTIVSPEQYHKNQPQVFQQQPYNDIKEKENRDRIRNQITQIYKSNRSTPTQLLQSADITLQSFGFDNKQGSILLSRDPSGHALPIRSSDLKDIPSISTTIQKDGTATMALNKSASVSQHLKTPYTNYNYSHRL